MGSFFGSKLREHRKGLGLSSHRICRDTGVNQGNMSSVERGVRAPSKALITILANYAPLHISEEQLLAWADVDTLQEEGLARLRQYVPEIFDGASTVAEGTPAEHDGPITAEFFGDVPYPPDEWELSIINDASKLGIRLGSIHEPGFWADPAALRRRTFIFTEELVREERDRRARRRLGASA